MTDSAVEDEVRRLEALAGASFSISSLVAVKLHDATMLRLAAARDELSRRRGSRFIFGPERRIQR